MKRVICLMAVAGAILFSYAALAADEAKSDPERGESAFDDLVRDFEKKGAYGAVVKVGYDKKSAGMRFGAAAHIGVSPDSYNKYRFGIYVVARSESGDVVGHHAHVTPHKFIASDSYKWGVYTTHEKPKPGTYTVTATLTAIAEDGSVMILDQGRSTTYQVK
jgi:hypothetical protein